MNNSILAFAGGVALTTSLYLVGCYGSADKGPIDKDVAMQALLVANANSVSVAVSALDSLDRGEIDVARSTLEGEVKAGLTVLHSMEPLPTMPDADVAAMVRDSIAEGDAYAKKRNLTVIRR